MTETFNSLAEKLGLEVEQFNNTIHEIDANHKYIKDLKINVLNSLQYDNLTTKESYLLAYATALNEKKVVFADAFKILAEKEGASNEELAEVVSAVSLMNINNVFYRFRHYTNKDYYNQTPAGIKMSIMMNPVLGKEFFELLSLAISALNGCEMCVKSHEVSVLNHGCSEARVYDAIILVANIKGFLVIA